jgi:hypothetical protein
MVTGQTGKKEKSCPEYGMAIVGKYTTSPAITQIK